MCGRHYQSYWKYGDPLYVEKYGRPRNQVLAKLTYEESHKEIDGIEHKLCRQCEKFKPMNEEHFYRKKKNLTDGFDTYCKECAGIKATQWRLENRERYNENQRAYHSQEEWKEDKRKRNKKWRENGGRKDWEERNKDKLSEYNQYREQNKRHEFTEKEFKLCKEYFNNECAYCGISEDKAKEIYGQNFHRDHAHHDGSNDLNNCLPACRDCNIKKWKYPLLEWYSQENEVFSVDRLDKLTKCLDGDWKSVRLINT